MSYQNSGQGYGYSQSRPQIPHENSSDYGSRYGSGQTGSGQAAGYGQQESYSQSQAGYGSYAGYAQQNPYSSQGREQGSYGQQSQSYQQNQYQQPAAQHGFDGQNDVEMQALGRPKAEDENTTDRYYVANKSASIFQEVVTLEKELNQLKGLQQQYASRTSVSSRGEDELHQKVQNLDSKIYTESAYYAAEIKKLKTRPESGIDRNAQQLGRAERRLRNLIQEFKKQDTEYRRTLDETLARQLRTVNPDATDAEIRAAIEDSAHQQVFTQALMQSDRRGQAQRVADEVRSRNADIRKIEETIVALNRLFQDLDAAVIQQEAAVTQIEQRGEEVNDHVAKANTELDSAVKKARAARRKKWYCLGIAVLIVIIIVVIVVVLVEVLKKN